MILTSHTDVPTADTLVIDARDVCVSFGGVRALDHASLRVGQQEIVGLIGPNGAGKSTLVGVLAGTTRARSGSVRILGRDARSASVRSRSRHGLARTFQHPALFPSLSVRENLEFGDAVRSRSGRRLTDAEHAFCDGVVESLDVARWLDWIAGDVPHPVQRMVEVARALRSAPRVLLVDEPAAGLPEATRERLVVALESFRSTFGGSVLLVEHDVPLVLATCDRITVLHEGRILADATPETVRNDPQVIDAYFGAAL